MIIKEIDARRAYRALDTRSVPEDVIQRIVTAATLAPSCANHQPGRFVVASTAETLEKVKAGLSRGNYWAQKAPLIVLVLTSQELDAQLSDNRNYAFFDTGMAAMNLMLQATAEGLYAHPIAGFDPTVVKENLGISDDLTLITLINVGYPGPEDHLNEKHRELEHGPRARTDQQEVISYNAAF